MSCWKSHTDLWPRSGPFHHPTVNIQVCSFWQRGRVWGEETRTEEMRRGDRRGKETRGDMRRTEHGWIISFIMFHGVDFQLFYFEVRSHVWCFTLPVFVITWLLSPVDSFSSLCSVSVYFPSDVFTSCLVFPMFSFLFLYFVFFFLSWSLILTCFLFQILSVACSVVQWAFSFSIDILEQYTFWCWWLKLWIMSRKKPPWKTNNLWIPLILILCHK